MRITRASITLLAFLLLATAALAQSYAGKLNGKVTREGTPVGGIAVTLTSPQLQGLREAVTSPSGEYLFGNLPPGEYTAVFSGEGVEPLSLDLRVAAAQTVTLDAELVPSYEETLVVSGETPREATVSQSAQGSMTLPKTLVDELPVGRGLASIVALSPGVLPTGPTKSEATGLSSITIAGAPTYENLFMLNGVVLNENLRGQPFDLFIEDAIQETTVIASSISAEYGRFSGGVVNAITKSGGNDFSGSFRTSLTNQSWSSETPLTTSQTDEVVPVYEATFGGPLLEDRLWFFAAGRDSEVEETRNTHVLTGLEYQRIRDQQRYEGKLTATLTPRHSLFGTYSKIDDLEVGNSFQAILDLESLVTRETPQELWALNYAGSLTDNLLLTAQYSEREFSFVNSGATSRDLITGTLVIAGDSGVRWNSPTFCGVCPPEERNNENLTTKVSYFLSDDSLGTHDLVAGFDMFNDIRKSDNHQSGSDFRVFTSSVAIRGGRPFPIVDSDGSGAIVFNPILRASEGTDFKTLSYFVNDTWRLGDRLTFNLGLRFDQNDGVNAEGAKVAEDSALSPRLAASFDPRGKGRLRLHASYGQYVAALANSVADSSSSAGFPATLVWDYFGPAINLDPDGPLVSTHDALRIMFDWFRDNGGFDGTFTPDFTSIPGGTTLITESLDSPNVTEYSLGVSGVLGSRGSFRLDLVHRDWANFYSNVTNLSTGRVVTASGPADVTLVQNEDDLLERTYDGLHAGFRYAAREAIELGGSWTLSRSRGNFDGETGASGPVRAGVEAYPEYSQRRWNAPVGYLTIDQRHRATLYGIFNLLAGERHSVSLGLLQSYFSGRAYSAAGTVSLLAVAGVPSSNYVTNPGYAQPPSTATYFFSDRGAFRTPDVFRTDLSVNYAVELWGTELFLDGEVINVFDEQRVDTVDTTLFNTTVQTAASGGAAGASLRRFDPFTETPVEGVHWRKGPLFGQPTGPLAYQTPRTFRLGVGLRF